MTETTTCLLCQPQREQILWRDSRCRIIGVGDADYPGFCRVIWQQHVREMSDLSTEDRQHILQVVNGVEETLRAVLRPDKINLASFGNQIPHLHWHVIPRFVDDPHFPDPVWAARKRDGARRSVDYRLLTDEFTQRLRR
ncbi:MAG: HIT family protein [Gammaproteobacteria bacterium]|nr:HIT family protein [Gammaproteobacteria bacterium]